MSGRLEKRAKPHSASRKSPDWTGIDWAGNAVLERLDGNVDSQTRLTTASCYIVQATTIPA